MSPSKIKDVSANSNKDVSIIDIKDESFKNFDLEPSILDNINKPFNQKSIPTLVLYDDKGLQLFDKITYLDEYYLTEAEIDILKCRSDDIINLIPDDSYVIELGSGSLRKTKVILDAIERNRKGVNYYALDVMEKELVKSLQNLKDYNNLKCHGLCGTYDDGMKFIQQLPKEKRKTILWLGSSIGNYNRNDAKEFVEQIHQCLNPGDLFIIGIDLRKDSKRISLAYNDPKGVSRDFILNGLNNCNNILGLEFFNLNNFEFKSVVNEEKGFHNSRFISTCDQTLNHPRKQLSIEIKKDEEIDIEYSIKYSLNEIDSLIENTKFLKQSQWFDATNSYSLNVIYKPPFNFSKIINYSIIPSIVEWEEIFQAWEYIVFDSIKEEDLLKQPISLRHPILFYLGHIPAFLDIQLSKHLKWSLIEPKEYTTHFERGIDPDVDEPSKCHSHSELPKEWPTRNQIIEYHDKVKQRLFNILNNKEMMEDKRLLRILSYVFEHQVMHLETLLYMLIRCDTIQYKNIYKATFNNNIEKINEAQLLTINEGQVIVGRNDIESEDFNKDDKSLDYFGWDNESPQREVKVKEFQIQSRPVTNGEFLQFLKETVNKNHPAQWSPINNNNNEFEFKVRTLLGHVSMEEAENWPVSVSYEQAKQYSAWKNMRLPTEEELLLFYNQYNNNNNNNNNIGFKNFHPKPVNEIQTYGDGWEWSNTLFSNHEGFIKSELYPNYSIDFFDNKHYILLGGSYITHPRLIHRQTFRNWYHKSYPYMFSIFRCAI